MTTESAEIQEEGNAGPGEPGECESTSFLEQGRRVSVQVTKGRRGMPRQQKAKKDVASCEKLRGAAHRR